MMDQKKGNIIHISAVLIGIYICFAQAAVTRESNKFIFPENIRGINYSAADELKPYQIKYNPVDLGDDILDDTAPDYLKQALINATLSNDFSLNQYAHHDGLPRLRKSIAKFYSKILNRELDPEENVVVTAGATGGVYNAFHGHTSPGDEWIVIEPAYTMYLPMIKMARGVPRLTSLKLNKRNGTIAASDWILDKDEMESLFNRKTKGILLNNPNNPTGKVYTYEELSFIADLAKKWNTIVITDEAHEWVTHKAHVRIASLPGMFERTITIGTASKSFSVSGWRVGWAFGAAAILNHVKTINARSIDSAPTPAQDAVAFAFEEELRNFGKPESFFNTHLEHVKEAQDFMVRAFRESGMIPVVPEGGFCVIADWTSLKKVPVDPKKKGASMKFIKWLIKTVGVLGLPVSTFYGEEHSQMGENYVRYCFHKKKETLLKAAQRLRKLNYYQ